ncbi:SurA N-terminal domain-containing protein [Streptomyces sp. NBC_00083]|uniref:SurA N-terminal domain-containing protein n=1 Tax=Streptomyces sp. NBC_00083 TaxID=2975647 RepID=UPI0022521B70|nr:SurA N-terminal domain-containing protein [Streptomyces sp. NBC_00083]MCX5382002.1 SurA N-terminal domain-containing protein [Streptomyces sp. NBC_00083]
MHRRRRTALSVSVVLLAAGPFLAACGGTAHPGAAAVVGGERIEVSALQAEVKDVRTAQQGSPQSAQLIKDSGQLGKVKLSNMIFDRVLARAAEQSGVSVSRKETQDARAAMVQQAGGEDQLREQALTNGGLAPDQIDTYVRRQVLEQKLAAKIGARTQQDLLPVLVKASKDLHVDVNPRYGSWNASQIQLADYQAPWIAKAKQPAAPQAGTDQQGAPQDQQGAPQDQQDDPGDSAATG